MNESVSIIIPAYNEEDNIGEVIDSTVHVVSKLISDYEIIVIDDGSKDDTYKIAEGKSDKNERIKIIRHTHNQGFGITIKDGIAEASKKYITGIPGDNDTSPKTLSDLIKERHNADIIFAYMNNPTARRWIRRFFSSSFTRVMNLLFGLKLRYYNSYFICRLDQLKKIPIRSKGLAIFAEAKVRLIKSGASYKEIPFEHTGRIHGKSSAVSLRSILRTVDTVIHLTYDIYLWSTS